MRTVEITRKLIEYKECDFNNKKPLSKLILGRLSELNVYILQILKFNFIKSCLLSLDLFCVPQIKKFVLLFSSVELY